MRVNAVLKAFVLTSSIASTADDVSRGEAEARKLFLHHSSDVVAVLLLAVADVEEVLVYREGGLSAPSQDSTGGM